MQLLSRLMSIPCCKIVAARACQAVAEVLAALKVVALEARVLDIPAKQAIT